MSETEKSIRANFAGYQNKGIRYEIRDAIRRNPKDPSTAVRSLAKRIALTAQGITGLEAVALTLEAT